nr:MAG TPA: chromosome partitioning protein [Caudoviricetes sp.]
MGYLDKLKAKADSNAAGELKMLPLEALEPSSRNFYRMCEIDQLADSIAANGLEQNLVVKAETGGKYRIVTGHRRYQALLRLVSRGVRIQTVPCIVRPAESDAQEMLRMIASNQYRELTDYEKMVQVEQATTAVKTLRSVKVAELGGIRLDGPTREVVSRLTGMSGPAVSKYAGIAEKLIPELKARMEQGLLPFTVAYAACQYPAGWQKDMTGSLGVVSLKDVQEVAVKRAVREALFSDLSDELDATASSSENTNRLKAVCDGRIFTIPGGGRVQGFVGGTMFIGRGNVNWMVEVMAWKFCEVADSMYKNMMTGTWKQEEERKRFKDVSREALDRMDGELEELPEACVQDETSEKTEGAACGPMTSIGLYKGERQAAEGLPSSAAAAAPSPEGEGLKAESGVSRTPPPTDDPADTEEEAVESGRFGELRNALSGKSAALEDKAWDQIIVWNREPPPEDVYAVVHYRIEDSEMEDLAYWHKNRGVWSMDRNGAYALEADVLGWFRVPKWEG